MAAEARRLLLQYLDRWEELLRTVHLDGATPGAEHRVERTLPGGTRVVLEGPHAYVFESFLLAGFRDDEELG